MNRTRRLVWKRENTLKGKVPNHPGIYRFYNKQGRLIYVGHAGKLRHRVQSYGQADCANEHPTKTVLRKRIHSYSYTVMPEKKARELEKKAKKNSKFNFN